MATPEFKRGGETEEKVWRFLGLAVTGVVLIGVVIDAINSKLSGSS